MNINCVQNEGDLLVVLDGRLDTTTAPELESFLNSRYDSISTLVIDCEKLVYVSSAGLRILLSAQKKTKGAMKLIRVCELVMEVFEMTGFADILVIE